MFYDRSVEVPFETDPLSPLFLICRRRQRNCSSPCESTGYVYSCPDERGFGGVCVYVPLPFVVGANRKIKCEPEKYKGDEQEKKTKMVRQEDLNLCKKHTNYKILKTNIVTQPKIYFALKRIK